MTLLIPDCATFITTEHQFLQQNKNTEKKKEYSTPFRIVLSTDTHTTDATTTTLNKTKFQELSLLCTWLFMEVFKIINSI